MSSRKTTKNPKTNTRIPVNGPTFNKLIEEGYLYDSDENELYKPKAGSSIATPLLKNIVKKNTEKSTIRLDSDDEDSDDDFVPSASVKKKIVKAKRGKAKSGILRGGKSQLKSKRGLEDEGDDDVKRKKLNIQKRVEFRTKRMVDFGLLTKDNKKELGVSDIYDFFIEGKRPKYNGKQEEIYKSWNKKIKQIYLQNLYAFEQVSDELNEESRWLKVIQGSYEYYKKSGERSSDKVDYFHLFIKDEILYLFSKKNITDYSVVLEYPTASLNPENSKNCDIVIIDNRIDSRNKKVVYIFPVKLLMAGIKANKFNYFESLTGETLNLKWVDENRKIVPIYIWMHKTPALTKQNEIKKFEEYDYKDIEYYQILKNKNLAYEFISYIVDNKIQNDIGEVYTKSIKVSEFFNGTQFIPMEQILQDIVITQTIEEKDIGEVADISDIIENLTQNDYEEEQEGQYDAEMFEQMFDDTTYITPYEKEIMSDEEISSGDEYEIEPSWMEETITIKNDLNFDMELEENRQESLQKTTRGIKRQRSQDIEEEDRIYKRIRL